MAYTDPVGATRLDDGNDFLPTVSVPRLAFPVLSFFVLLAAMFLAPATRAEGPKPPLAVLTLDSDTLDEHAEALTLALRRRARASETWSLLDTTASLATMVLVLGCPKAPDPPCLARIGDQLHADQFLWGNVSRGSQSLSATVHLWMRAKPDVQSTATYPDTLKSAESPELRRVASRLFASLLSESSTLVVHAEHASGQVLVDGITRAPLEQGTARLVLAPGTYRISLRVPGFREPSRQLVLEPGAQEEMVFALEQIPPAALPPVAPTPQHAASESSWRRIAGYGATAAGTLVLAAGVYEALRFFSLRSDLDEARRKVPSTITDVCASSSPAAVDACRVYQDATGARTLAYVFVPLGVVAAAGGMVLLLTESPVYLSPRVSAEGASLDLRVRF
ncbi:MAG: hypothetical protein WCI05_09360 [Myxococcales bacterium]